MTQPLVSAGYGNGTYLFGSVLHGGDDYSGTVLSSMNTALNSYNPKIPVTYGKDMMHGAAAISGATIFPHNIGMGATRDSALVRRACEVTARESWAGNVDLIFGPAISVPQDARWGRTYEGFGETPELAVMMGAACVRGYQGDKYNADWRVIATAKHYLADGGTAYGTGVNGGMDRGNVTANDETIRAIHLPGYEAVIEQGVLSIMASFNQIREIHQHVDSLRLTGWLKTELGFDGYIISDWLGIGNSELPGTSNGYSGQTATTSQNAIRKAINAGIDLAMEPGTQSSFISGLKTLVSNNSVSTDRINDAVRRILRAKFRAGRMDNPAGISTFVKNKYGDIGNSEHRNVAREAVRKSLVLLKNENSALPISKTAKVFVTGSHADVPSYQCGGWTLGWQGALNTNWQTGAVTGPKTVPGATSIQSGIYNVATRANSASEADVIIYVTGEQPYAEWHGDISSLELTDNTLASLRSGNSGKKIVTIFISGRPREVNSMISNSDAFVAAWLPGSEGAGVADVLFGDYKPTGKLPMKWPGTPNYPYGFGLTYP
jgi:beta-glucosidase